MPPGGFGVAIEAYADPDACALQCFEHRPLQQGAVGLDGHVHSRWHLSAERTHQAGQPLPSGEQRFTAMQDDLDAGEVVLGGVLGDPLDGGAGDRLAHPPWQASP